MISHLNGYSSTSRFATALAAIMPGTPAVMIAILPWGMPSETTWLPNYSAQQAEHCWGMTLTGQNETMAGEQWPLASHEQWWTWPPETSNRQWGEEASSAVPEQTHVAAQWHSGAEEPMPGAGLTQHRHRAQQAAPEGCSAAVAVQDYKEDNAASQKTVEKNASDSKHQCTVQGLTIGDLTEKGRHGRLKGHEAVHLLSLLQEKGELENSSYEGFKAQNYY